MARLLYRLGAGAVRRRLLTVLIWVLILGGLGVGGVTLSGDTVDSFSIPGQESSEALDLIEQEFGAGGSDTSSAQVVLHAEDGGTLTSPDNVAAVSAVVQELGTLPGVVGASDPLDPTSPTISADQTTAFSTVTYDSAAQDISDADRDALLDAVSAAGSSTLQVEVSGEAATETVAHAPIGEVIGVLIALVILAVTYGALTVSGMNLVTALVGVGSGLLGIMIVSGFVTLQSTTSALAVMLGLAVGIDYALFIITRFRQELRKGSDVATAVAVATGTAGSAVVTAALTVVIALAGLAVVGIPFLTQMGVAAAATVLIAAVVAITLLPAILGYVGRRALPRKERAVVATAPVALPAETAPTETTQTETTDADDAPTGRGFFTGWVGGLTRRPILALLAVVIGLGAASIPVLSLQSTLSVTPAEDSTAGRAQELLADGFGEGFNGPLTVLVRGDGASTAAAGLASTVADLGDVATVTAPIPNADDTAALLTVIPDSGPTSEATIALVDDLRAAIADTSGIDGYVTGTTAISVDVGVALSDALPIYLVLVVGLALVLLILVFRSLLVPVIAVLGFLLTLGSSLGATVAVFQWGWLGGLLGLDSTGPLLSITPILIIGILFGLAMDYQIFLVSRMHEAHGHGASPLQAVHRGFRQAAPVVVAAALIMFSVFAAFFPAGDATIKQIAFALAVGVLVDAFVVRMVLVPASLALMGERAWWLPRWLRWLPHLDVEGTAITEARSAEPADPAGQDELIPDTVGSGSHPSS